MDKQKMDLESLDEINGGCHWAEAPSFKARVDFVNEMRKKYDVYYVSDLDAKMTRREREFDSWLEQQERNFRMAYTGEVESNTFYNDVLFKENE